MSFDVALATCSSLPDWEVDDKLLIDALRNCGVTVHTPSWTDDVDWNMFDSTIIRTTWDYHLHLTKFLDWTRCVPRLYNSCSIIKWNTHKSYLRDLEQLGVPIAPTVWVRQHEIANLASILKNFKTDRGFIKPLVGASASDTLRFDETQIDVATAFLRERSNKEMMVQPYIQSVETTGELSAIFIDEVFTHGVQKNPVDGDYRVQDDWGATDQPYDFNILEIEAMKKLLTNVPHEGTLLYARVDYLRDSTGALLLNELELVEPSLFFRHSPAAATSFAHAITRISTHK